MCSVFLLTPDADMKLDGFSLRAALKADGKEYLFKIFDRAMRGEPGQSQGQMVRQLTTLLSGVPTMPAFLDVIKRGIAGDEDARAEAVGMGLWQCWRAGAGDRGPLHQRIAIDHAIEVEQACRRAALHLRDKSFDHVAASIADAPLIRPYASDASLARLAVATSDLAALPTRAACLCEFLLSQVARVDVRTAASRSAGKGDEYGHLLFGVDRCNPGGAVIRWIQARLGAATLADILTLNAESSAPAIIDESTLKRWSSGAAFPSGAKLGKLVASILTRKWPTLMEVEPELDLIGSQYWAARRLQKLLEIARRLQALDNSTVTPFGWQQMMGDTTPDAWCRRRYPLWVAHWRKQDLANGCL